MMSWIRIRALIIKEFLAVLRDPKSRFILFGPPLMQMIIFSTAATLDVHNVDLMVLNQDNGHYSQEIINRVQAAKPTFRNITRADNFQDIEQAINRQKIVAALVFSSDFSRQVSAGQPATFQVIVDGRKSNTAQIAFGYINQISNTLSQNITIHGSMAQVGAPQTTINVISQYWFNPNLIFQWFMVPNLVASIALLVGLIVTALTISREREVGTFDQLLVSPLKPSEILIGKVIPPMCIGFVQLLFFVLAALFIFGIPLRGSLFLLFISSFFFLLSVAGIGIFISALVRTQQQAILGAFLFLAPAMLLSGFATPLENMPTWLQPITYIDPLRYFLIIVRGSFLKDIPAIEVFHQTWPLALIGFTTLFSAALLFKKRIE